MADESTEPEVLYRERLACRQAALDRLLRQDQRISQARMAVFLCGVALATSLFVWPHLSAWWLLLPILAFVALAIQHETVLRRIADARRRVRFYEEGLRRLSDTWAGRGVRGEGLAPPGHVYAADLDLFGEGSLFERLCTARTRAGEARLAAWLLAPSDPEAIVERQGATRDLKNRLDLREDLATLGDDVRATVEPEVLVRWAEAPPVLAEKGMHALLLAATFLNLASFVARAVFSLSFWYFGGTLLAGAVLLRVLAPRVEAVLGAVERPGRELHVLAGVLERFEAEPVADPYLAQLQQSLKSEGREASRLIHRLSRLVERAGQRRNQLFMPIALMLLWTPHHALSIEGWRRRHGRHVARWLDAVGELEALSSLAAYAFENPEDPFAEIVDEGGPLFEATGLGHPLLPRARCVTNDVTLGSGVDLVVVSGSNMSGKSTFLRAIGSNTVLALAGAPVRARSLRLSCVQVGASIRVQDSLLEGASRFWAEIVRLKAILELARRGGRPLLFLLDELLSGTNSHDRRIGAEGLLRSLLEAGAAGVVTTHDLALADIADALGPRARNVHFSDVVVDGELRFDYRLREGRVTGSNALALMRAVGLDVGSPGNVAAPEEDSTA